MSELRFYVHEPIRQVIKVTHAAGALAAHIAASRRSAEVYRQTRVAPMPGIRVGTAAPSPETRVRRSSVTSMPGIAIGVPSPAPVVHARTALRRSANGHWRMPGIAIGGDRQPAPRAHQRTVATSLWPRMPGVPVGTAH